MILLSENLINTAYPRAFCLVPTKWISLSKWLRKFKRLNFIDKMALRGQIYVSWQIILMSYDYLHASIQNGYNTTAKI